jgi:hypothetical protein
MLYDKLSYYATEETIENNINIILEERDLTLLGLWKKNFFNLYYKCDYLYSQK